jgi:hypothetical protein
VPIPPGVSGAQAFRDRALRALSLTDGILSGEAQRGADKIRERCDVSLVRNATRFGAVHWSSRVSFNVRRGRWCPLSRQARIRVSVSCRSMCPPATRMIFALRDGGAQCSTAPGDDASVDESFETSHDTAALSNGDVGAVTTGAEGLEPLAGAPEARPTRAATHHGVDTNMMGDELIMRRHRRRRAVLPVSVTPSDKWSNTHRPFGVDMISTTTARRATREIEERGQFAAFARRATQASD